MNFEQLLKLANIQFAKPISLKKKIYFKFYKIPLLSFRMKT